MPQITEKRAMKCSYHFQALDSIGRGQGHAEEPLWKKPNNMKICDPKLHGRSAEESILLNSYFASLSISSSVGRSSSEAANSSVILICGDSGVGKSRIAETLQPHVVEDDGYFLRGKFDQLSYYHDGGSGRGGRSSSGSSGNNEDDRSNIRSDGHSPHVPYSGIASALSEYCAQLEQRGQDDWREVTSKLQREIGQEEGRVLYEAIPALKKLLTTADLVEEGDDDAAAALDTSEKSPRSSKSSNKIQLNSIGGEQQQKQQQQQQQLRKNSFSKKADHFRKNSFSQKSQRELFSQKSQRELFSQKSQRELFSQKSQRESFTSSTANISSLQLNINLEEEKEAESPSDFELQQQSQSQNDFESESRSHRLNYLMKKFIRVVSTIGDPIVLLIDDMQWVDSSSLDLIRALILGAQNPFTFLFTYRPVDPFHPFLQLMNDLQNHTRISKTEIQLRNLRKQSVKDLVATLLSIDVRKERWREHQLKLQKKQQEHQQQEEKTMELQQKELEKQQEMEDLQNLSLQLQQQQQCQKSLRSICSTCTNTSCDCSCSERTLDNSSVTGSNCNINSNTHGSSPGNNNTTTTQTNNTANDRNLCNDLQNLTNAICNITNGNPFFIRQQIICWIDQGLIIMDETRQEWAWDIDAIRECGALKDVVSMISEKIRRLEDLTQSALTICACMGSKTDLYVLGLLLRELRCPQDPQDDEIIARNAVELAIQEGLLVQSQDRTAVTFVHDSIQSAAYSLLEADKQASFHLRLGRLLQKKLSPCLYQQHFFTIANQLARGYKLISEREERLDALLTFNLAGDKSKTASAFPEAQFFFARGIHMICDENDWGANYRLCIDIYSKAAEAAAITGDYEQMEEWLKVVFLRARELEDQFRAHYIRVRGLASRGDMEPAVDVGLEAMKLVGVKIPSKNVLFHTLVDLAKTRCLMKKKSVQDLMQLPPIEEKQMMPLRLMNLLCTLSVSAKKKMCPLICFKTVQLNVKYGMTSGMPTSMALYGALLVRFGFPVADAAKYCEMANAIQERLEIKDSIPNVVMLSYGIVFTFTKPLADCMAPLPLAYKAGLEFGDIMHGVRCAAVWAWVSFFSSGLPLSQYMTVLEKHSKYMIEFNSTSTLLANQAYQQVAANFQGSAGASPNPAFLSGDYFDKEVVASKYQCQTMLVMHEQSQLMEVVLAYFFGHYDAGWEVCEELSGNGAPSFKGLLFTYIYAFYRGLTALAQYNCMKSIPYLKAAKSCLKELQAGQKLSPLNLTHQHYLLQAEYAVVKKKYDLAEKYYSLSISHAAERNVLHEQALARERFGYYHCMRNNHEAAYEQMRAANELYKKWGGRAKCDHLAKRFPHLLDAPRDHKELLQPTKNDV